MSAYRTFARALSFASILAPAAALAHAQLQQAVPSVGGSVTSSPQEVRLRFSEGVEPRFSSVALASEAGEAIALGRAATDPADQAVLIARIGRTLRPGTYVVTWHVVSVDTHKTQGSFEFTVSP